VDDLKNPNKKPLKCTQQCHPAQKITTCPSVEKGCASSNKTEKTRKYKYLNIFHDF